MAERFTVSSEDYPVYKLFVGDPSPKNAIAFEGSNKKRIAILMFLKNNGVYVGLPTCIELFDELASEFMEAKTSADQTKAIHDAESEASKIPDKLKRVSI